VTEKLEVQIITFLEDYCYLFGVKMLPIDLFRLSFYCCECNAFIVFEFRIPWKSGVIERKFGRTPFHHLFRQGNSFHFFFDRSFCRLASNH